jgi:hypothetical protein
MSRGQGHVQRAILALIDANADGAWSTATLCERVYSKPDVSKAQRVALSRALRRMQLPPGWRVWSISKQGSEYCLLNGCSVESVARWLYLGFSARPWASEQGFEDWKRGYSHMLDRAHEHVEAVQRWENASPAEKIDIEIKDLQEQLGLARMSGGATPEGREWLGQAVKQITALQALKAELAKSAAG